MRKKRGREDESYNISEVMSKEVKLKREGHIKSMLSKNFGVLNYIEAVYMWLYTWLLILLRV